MKQVLLLIFMMLFSTVAHQAIASEVVMDTTEAISFIDLEDEFTLLTNPVKNGVLKLRVNKTDTKKVAVTVINSLGDQVFTSSSHVNKQVIDFDISKLAAGIYFLRIQSDSHSSVKKLIIQ